MNDDFFPDNRPDGTVPGEVLEAMKTGDPGAYKRIYVSYYTHIRNFLNKLLGSMEDANDIAQEVFITLWEKRENIDSQKNIKSYIFTIARHKAYRHLTDKKSLTFEDSDPRTLEALLDNAGATDKVDTEEIQLLVEIAMLNMPRQQRAVISLSLEGKTNDEIAKELGTTKAVVKQQLYIARKDISELLFLVMLFLMP